MHAELTLIYLIDAHITWVIQDPDFVASRSIGILGLTTHSNFLLGKNKNEKKKISNLSISK